MAGVVADDDRDEASRLSGQRARGRIGAVADLARHLADALTRRPSDVALVVERPGHGRDRDTGALGNVLDRGSSRHELHDTSTGITGGERCPREYKLEFSFMKRGFRSDTFSEKPVDRHGSRSCGLRRADRRVRRRRQRRRWRRLLASQLGRAAVRATRPRLAFRGHCGKSQRAERPVGTPTGGRGWA